MLAVLTIPTYDGGAGEEDACRAQTFMAVKDYQQLLQEYFPRSGEASLR